MSYLTTIMMPSSQREFLNLIGKSIRFEFHAGDSTWVTYPHSTGWRTLPSLVVAQTAQPAVIELLGEKPQNIEAGQALVVAPQVRHNITKVTRPAGYSHWTHFQCEVFSGVSLFYVVEPPMIFKAGEARKIGRICKELGKLKGAPSLSSIIKQQALGWSLISTILLPSVAFKEDRIELIRKASRLSPVLAYIEQNLARPITHQLLARTACLSPSRFHSLFRAALGCAPYEYVQKMRLKKAQELLIRTARSIAEIGQEVGHADPYHFSRVFRQKVGVSPSKYRNQMKIGSF